MVIVMAEVVLREPMVVSEAGTVVISVMDILMAQVMDRETVVVFVLAEVVVRKSMNVTVEAAVMVIVMAQVVV